MKIRDMVIRGVEVIRPDATLREAARRMRQEGVRVLFVLEDRRLAGILTDRDVTLAAVAAGRSPDRTRVREAHTARVVYCHEDDDVREVVRTMREQRLRRLAVLDADERLVGMVELADLVAELTAEPREPAGEPARARHWSELAPGERRPCAPRAPAWRGDEDLEQQRWAPAHAVDRGAEPDARELALGSSSREGEPPWGFPAGPARAGARRVPWRSDDRVRDDVCQRLTEDGGVDASEVAVLVREGEVTLEGTVADREQKRRAERIAESVRGVCDVVNMLRLTAGPGAREPGAQTGNGPVRERDAKPAP